MVEEYEINSCIVKFKQLWKSGLSAHLDLDTSAGKAWVGLRLQLGDSPHPQHHQEDHHQHQQKSRDSPTKERRRNRRASLRKQKDNEDHASASEEEEPRDKANLKAHEETAKDVLLNHNEVTEEVQSGNIVENKETVEKEVHEKVAEEVISGDKVEQEAAVVVHEKVHVAPVNEIEAVTDLPAKKEALEEPTSDKAVLQEVSDEANDIDKNVNNEKQAIPTSVVVYATAVLENCPYSKVNSNHIDSLSNIIDSKDQLQSTIEDFKFGNITTWEYGINKFKHQIGVILDVKTAQLWESARGYLFKHLGTSTWTLNDGTEVNLIRIHQR